MAAVAIAKPSTRATRTVATAKTRTTKTTKITTATITTTSRRPLRATQPTVPSVPPKDGHASEKPPSQPRSTTSTDHASLLYAIQHSKCSQSTVLALRAALRLPEDAKKTSVTAKKSDKTDCAEPTPPPRSIREKVVLATQAINTSLKALSEVSRLPPNIPAGTTPDSARALADCARAALAFLLRVDGEAAGQDAQAPLPRLQLEQGMLALVGRMITLGLGKEALAEVRVLKKRLEGVLAVVKGRDKQAGKDDATLLVELISFNGVRDWKDIEPAVLQLVVQYYGHALKVLAAVQSLKRAGVAKDLLAALAFDNPSSPTNAALCTVPDSKDDANMDTARTKAARHLETLASSVLSLCPASSPTEDTDPAATADPQAVLALQTLALRMRLRWWQLVAHEGDADREIVGVFGKCVAAFQRRQRTANGDEKRGYTKAKGLWKELRDDVEKFMGKNKGGSTGRAAICRALSSLAQGDEALEWALKWEEELRECGKDVKHTASAVRVAAQRLGRVTTYAGEIQIIEEALHAATRSLHGDLKGDGADLDAILAELVDLRKAASRACVDFRLGNAPRKLDNDEERERIVKISFDAVGAGLLFLSRYAGAPPSDDTAHDPKASARQEERVAMARKVMKGFVDSALVCAKTVTAFGFSPPKPFAALDQLLSCCLSVLAKIEERQPDNEGDRASAETTLTSPPHVKLSHAYWIFATARGRAAPEALPAMRRAIDVLFSRPACETGAGLLAIKLEKLADTLLASGAKGSVAEARQALRRAIRVHVDDGVLAECALRARNAPVQRVIDEAACAGLGKAIMGLSAAAVRHGARDHQDALFDDEGLQAEERGLAFEWQLVGMVRALATTKSVPQGCKAVVSGLAERLLEFYAREGFPVRMKRAACVVAKAVLEFPEALEEALVEKVWCIANSSTKELRKDEGLEAHIVDLDATLAAYAVLSKQDGDVKTIKRAIAAWQIIVASSMSYVDLSRRIYDPESLLAILRIAAEYLDVRGLEYERASVLALTARVLSLKGEVSASDAALNATAHALQISRLGFVNEAGILFTNVQHLVSSTSPISATIRIQFLLAHAEHLIYNSSLPAAASALREASELFSSDVELKRLTTSAASNASRARLNRLLAEASRVSSLLALAAGVRTDALALARRAVVQLRRAWAGLESTYASRLALPPATTSSSPDADLPTPTPAQLPVMSTTHAALAAPALWPLVPALHRALAHLSGAFAHCGALAEALYFREQAQRVAGAVGPGPRLVADAAALAELHVRSGKVDKGSEYVEGGWKGLKALSGDGEIVGEAEVRYWLSVVGVQGLLDEEEAEMEGLDKAEEVLEVITRSQNFAFLDVLRPNGAEEDEVERKMRGLKIVDEEEVESTAKGRRTARKTPAARNKNATRGAEKVQQKSAAKTEEPTSPSTAAEEHPPLATLKVEVMHKRIAAMLLRNNSSAMGDMLTRAEALRHSNASTIAHQTLMFRRWTLEALKEVSTDLAFNVLPESTICFPAISQRNESPQSVKRKGRASSPTKKRRAAAQSPRKVGRGKRAEKDDFATLLLRARDCLSSVRELAVRAGSSEALSRVCTLLGQNAMLLSAVSPATNTESLDPLSAAHLGELPRQHALRMEHVVTEGEVKQITREEIFSWPATVDCPNAAEISLADFQRDYVDIIPDTWAAISLALSEDYNELYVTRYHAGEAPFILRLPLSRQSSRDADDAASSNSSDETHFPFADGQRELREIIELSNASVRDSEGRDMSSKAAKRDWWAEREALDDRMRALLANVDNIWLGGFRGALTPRPTRPRLLHRFGAALDDILNQHLPSRRRGGGRRAENGLALDDRVLALFVGLGDPDVPGVDLDEPLADLAYFAVDALQFAGERNAYDEVDFDALVVEVKGALSSYHAAVAEAETEDDYKDGEAGDEEDGRRKRSVAATRHTILLLDKHLHEFPWESLPSLRGLSISRLPSLAALRERMLAMRGAAPVSTSPSTTSKADGHVARPYGTTILNPGNDLPRTQRALAPCIDALAGSAAGAGPRAWTHFSGRAPSEVEFEAALARGDELVLYFGHGNGAQYVRGRSVRRLRCGSASARTAGTGACSLPPADHSAEGDTHPSVTSPSESGSPTTPPCATTWLMGCSSAALTPNGPGFEPSGPLASYLAAGAPAVLGMLWDVTDKDCDRFSREVGGRWGLWPMPETAGVEKKEGRKAGKGEVECARGATAGRVPGGRKGRGRVGEEEGEEDKVRRGEVGLDEAVRDSRGACYLRYLNGAAPVVYGIPVFLGS